MALGDASLVGTGLLGRWVSHLLMYGTCLGAKEPKVVPFMRNQFIDVTIAASDDGQMLYSEFEGGGCTYTSSNVLIRSEGTRNSFGGFMNEAGGRTPWTAVCLYKQNQHRYIKRQMASPGRTHGRGEETSSGDLLKFIQSGGIILAGATCSVIEGTSPQEGEEFWSARSGSAPASPVAPPAVLARAIPHEAEKDAQCSCCVIQNPDGTQGTMMCRVLSV
ncbi:hypothetical protein FB45DRAFT_1011144 [Roridomyces roridus]|uniref:Uncharacterized protein n=1 Tax=Roridomyces roridus TaxID=1738132 RepID=A0AAD7B2J5_9AGAR|nr:hypothetical protein FB45DRAFT_1011144 [Roridomyces roridus]